MKTRKQHQKLNSYLLGYDIEIVHKILDGSSQLVGPKNHREHSHTFSILKGIEYLYGDKGLNCAIIHIMGDVIL
jgi:hypothetical protein